MGKIDWLEIGYTAIVNTAILSIVMTLLVFFVSGENANDVVRKLVNGAVRDLTTIGAFTTPAANSINDIVQTWADQPDKFDKAVNDSSIKAKKDEKKREKNNANTSYISWGIVGALVLAMIVYSVYMMRMKKLTADQIAITWGVTIALFSTELLFFELVVKRWYYFHRQELYLLLMKKFLDNQGTDLQSACEMSDDVASASFNMNELVTMLMDKFE